MCYIMAEENYKPNGWLGSQLGKAIWIPAWNEKVLEENFQQIIERGKSFLSFPPNYESRNQVSKDIHPNSPLSPKDNPTQGLSDHVKELSDKIDRLTQLILELTTTVNELKNQRH